MPQLEVGSLDDIKTGFEPIPAQKKIKVRVEAPATAEDKQREVYEGKDGKFKMAKFSLKITEGPFAGRFVRLSVFTHVARETYLTWNLQKEGRPMTEAEKATAWDAKDFLKDLKRFGDAIGVNFATQPTEDTYGKELIIDITQKEVDGEIYNEARNPKKIA